MSLPVCASHGDDMELRKGIAVRGAGKASMDVWGLASLLGEDTHFHTSSWPFTTPD
jgi:hypothetical protein